MKTTILLNLVVLLLTAASVPAATRLVPDEYATIQAAIDDCVDGDVVIIAPDTYTGDGNRDIDFLGKAITVRSIDPNDPNVVAATIIDCSGTEAEPHRGFYFHNNEGPDSVLTGLTITNGYGPDERLDINGRIYDYSVGGAIFCYQSNPTITRCKIEGNRVKHIGGGMYNYDSSLTVTNCIFSDNWAGSGGGMYNYRGNPTVTNTAFVDNGADHSAGGMYNAKESNSMVTNCTFSENSAGYYGGAMYNRDDSNTIVTNCTFSNNSARFNGGGMENYASNPTISNCTFSENSAGEDGGGMYNDGYNGECNPILTNCMFSGNSAGFDGGGMYNHTGSYNRRVCNPTVTNCIFWDNRDKRGVTQSSQIYVPDDGTPTINYSCIQGWSGSLGGTANIDANPAFVYPATGNYHLLPNSPCINAGDPDYIPAPGETDIDGDPRVMDGRIDMGVDEFILTPEPIIGISAAEFEFGADVGGANPENQILTISNIGGGGTLYWMVTEDCPWLDVHPDSGESTGEIDEVTLSTDIWGMNSGLYICELMITAEGIVNSPQILQVTLHIYDNDGELHVPSEYGTIQAAIDTAIDGQAVILASRTYTGYGNRDLDFGGKAITVRSIDPNDPAVVSATVIDCQGTEANPHRGFRFHSGEGTDSIIDGLTITNGYGPNEAVGYMASAGGAIFCFASHPTISLCRIVSNAANYKGGGIYCEESNPMIANCTFSGNSSSYGCGIYCMESSPTITNCTFKGNMTNYPGRGSGAGIYSAVDSHPMITNCMFTSNSSHSQAGGIYNGDHCAPTISNCIFSGNSAKYGGAMYNMWYSTTKVSNCLFSGNWALDNGGAMLNSRSAEPTITNCTFTGNSAVGSGGSIFNSQSRSTLSNCVLWGNLPNEIDGLATVSYSNIQGSWQGQGNIDANPLFVDPSADNYHLLFESPCIDAGDPNFVPVPGEIDIDGEPRVMGGRVDMGADEFTSTLTPILRISPIEFQFSSYEDGPNPEEQIFSIRNIGSGTLNWEIDEDCPWLEVYPPNGESTGQVNEVTLSVDISGLTPDSYNCQLTIAAEGAVNSPQVVLVTLNLGGSELYVPLEYDTIQAAIDSAIDWDTVIVADGIYGGDGNRDIDFLGKAITVRSENGPEKCIIDCNGTEAEPHRGFYFHSGEDCNSVVAGFTITNGYARYGGGIYCSGSSPTITNCTFTGNAAELGGGMYNNGSPTLTSCTFSGNSAGRAGGGMYNSYSSPTLTNCTFSGNSAGRAGGGMYNSSSCSPVLTNCTFISNTAASGGGGMYGYGFICSPTLTNCIFIGNSAGEGGGMHNYGGRQTLTNCIFSGNSAGKGGGVFYTKSDPVLTNCTFSGNSAGQRGGGICYKKALIPPTGPGPGPGSPPEIANGTIVRNADTGIFYDSIDVDIIITNCIIWDNEAPDEPEIYLDSYSNAWVSYSDVQGGWPGESNIDAAPCFVELGYWDANGVWIDGDYHLLKDSLCIDAGDPNYIAEPNETDLDGRPRVIGSRIDMGAYEYSPPIPAEVRIVPRTINLTSKGKWIASLFWLPEDYNVVDIEPNSVVLEFLDEEIKAESFRVDEEQQVAIVRFSRSDVQGILAPGEVELTVSGELADGTVFEGTDTIRVIDKGGKKK